MRSVSVIGLGRLGAPVAVSCAAKGFRVIGLDVDPRKVNAIRRGRAPVFEPGLAQMLRRTKGRLSATHDYREAVLGSEATFILVPTPSGSNGKFSLRYVLNAAREIGKILSVKPGYHLVVLTSTVTPGATENSVKPLLEKTSGKKCGKGFGLCYSPEFVALGSVIRNFLSPDFVLIGESDPVAGGKLEGFYRAVCGKKPPIARMGLANAELTKLAVNAFVTTKISYANMLARICERLPGGNVDAVTSALGLDSRIGRKYLQGAIGYGGPCFPRDNRALSAFSRSLGLEASLADATDAINRRQVAHLQDAVRRYLPRNGTVGILGLAYKPDTNVAEQSQGILLAQALARSGAKVVAYDPAARMESARLLRGYSVRLLRSARQCLRAADVLVLTTPWKEFQRLGSPPGKKKKVLIDCWRVVEKPLNRRWRYIPLGRSL